MIKQTFHFLSRQEISGTVPRALKQSVHLQLLPIVTASVHRHFRNYSYKLPNGTDHSEIGCNYQHVL